jgi:hypothetical protein
MENATLFVENTTEEAVFETETGLSIANRMYLGKEYLNSSTSILICILALAIIHLISATLYWWAWRGN